MHTMTSTFAVSEPAPVEASVVEIWLESPTGGGACFMLSLPASPGSRQLKAERLGGAERCVQQK
jgi:hypothetical protein